MTLVTFRSMIVIYTDLWCNYYMECLQTVCLEWACGNGECTICCDLLSSCFTSLTLTEQSENKSNAGCSVSSDIQCRQRKLAIMMRLKEKEEQHPFLSCLDIGRSTVKVSLI